MRLEAFPVAGAVVEIVKREPHREARRRLQAAKAAMDRRLRTTAAAAAVVVAAAVAVVAIAAVAVALARRAVP